MESPTVAASPATHVYSPNRRQKLGLMQTWALLLHNMVRERNLIVQLFKRDFLAGYKKSFLGLTWLFIYPILGVVVWIFLRRTGLLQTGTIGVPYPVYVILGTTMWGFFAGSFKAAEQTLTAGRSLIWQVNYPREILLVKQVATTLAQFTITMLVTFGVMLGFGVVPAWQGLLLPLVLVPLFLFAVAFGLIAGMIAAVTIDIGKATHTLLGLAIWTTPVIYADTVPSTAIGTLIAWNPLTYLVCSARDVLLYGRLYDTTGYVVCSVLAVILFLLAWRLFYVTEHRLIERMI